MNTPHILPATVPTWHDSYWRTWYIERAKARLVEKDARFAVYGEELVRHFDRSFPNFDSQSIPDIGWFYRWMDLFIDTCRHAPDPSGLITD